MRLRQAALAIGVLWVTTAVAETFTRTESSPDALSSELKSCIEQMISIFENESPSLQYDVVEDFGDGRGYAAGRAGFSSRDGDLLEVVQLYDRMRPNNVLSVFVPTLKERRGTASTKGLEALPAAWKQAASDPLFRQAQDQISDKLYYKPAMQTATALHLRSPLAKLILYDAIIRHGMGDDPDSFDGLIGAATRTAQGPPDQSGEDKWLMAFLIARKDVLLNARDPELQESVSRVNEQMRLLKEGNLQLSQPLILKSYGTKFTLNCASPSSGTR